MLFTRGTASNASADAALQVICGYSLSSPYEVIPRVLLYPLLWSAYFSRTSLIIVMLWTAVTSIHSTALAVHRNNSVVDTDAIPAYCFTLIGAIFAPSYIMYARPLKNAGLVDRPAACLWMFLLWTGVVSFTATMHDQPRFHYCVNELGHNVTSLSELASCTFQCPFPAPRMAMRIDQSPLLTSMPDSYYTGDGTTDHWTLAGTTLLVPYIMIGCWMATITSMLTYMRSQVRRVKGKKNQEEYAKLFGIPLKISIAGFIIIVCNLEQALSGLSVRESKDVITQWGPMVAGMLGVLGWSARWFTNAIASAGEVRDPNVTAFQKTQNRAAMPPLKTGSAVANGARRASLQESDRDVEMSGQDVQTGLESGEPQRPELAHLPAGRLHSMPVDVAVGPTEEEEVKSLQRARTE